MQTPLLSLTRFWKQVQPRLHCRWGHVSLRLGSKHVFSQALSPLHSEYTSLIGQVCAVDDKNCCFFKCENFINDLFSFFTNSNPVVEHIVLLDLTPNRRYICNWEFHCKFGFLRRLNCMFWETYHRIDPILFQGLLRKEDLNEYILINHHV